MFAPRTAKLGIAPLSWTNDDLPSLGGDTPVSTVLRESKQAGYVGVETGGKFPTDPVELKAMLDEHSLQLAGGWFSGQLLKGTLAEEIDRAKEQLVRFKHCDAATLVYGETTETVQNKIDTPIDRRPRVGDVDRPAYYQRLADFAKHCADMGVMLGFHYHMGTAVETDAEIRHMLEHTPVELKMTVDTGHAAFAGGDAMALIRDFGDRIQHVHAKDIRTEIIDDMDRGQESFLDAVLKGGFTVPGDGGLDFADMAQALADVDYGGWIVVEAEQDPAKAHPLTYAKLGYDTLRPRLESCGFQIL